MRKRNLAASVLIAALVASTWAAGPAQARPGPTPFGSEQCATLAGLEVSPKAVDLPTTGAVVTEALWVQTPSNGQCRVKGSVRPVDPAAPVIGFQVNLPSNWNGRALQMGEAGSMARS